MFLFIDADGWKNFEEYYQEFQTTSHVIFKSPEDPSKDLFDMIIEQIEYAAKHKKIPFIIRSGCLWGTGIGNQNIMEHDVVMNSPNPLVVFYPSKIENDNLYFLNFEPASKYRCLLIK